MKTKLNTIIRLLAVLLILTYILPFITVTNNLIEIATELAHRYGEDVDYGPTEYLSLAKYTFGFGTFDGGDYPPDYGVRVEALGLLALAVAIVILGTKHSIATTVLSGVYTVYTLILYFIVEEATYFLLAGTDNPDYVEGYKDLYRIEFGIGFYLSVAISIILIVLAAISINNRKKKTKANSITNFNKNQEKDTEVEVTEVISGRCPVCETLNEDDATVCATCGTVLKSRNDQAALNSTVDTSEPDYLPKIDTMRCPNCASEIEDAFAFCVVCGYSLSGRNTETHSEIVRGEVPTIKSGGSGIKSTMRATKEATVSTPEVDSTDSFFSRPTDL